MFSTNSRLKRIFKRFFEKTLDFLFENDTDFPKPLSCTLLILYFLQILSYCYKNLNKTAENLSFLTLSSMIVYSNPANVLEKLENSIVFAIFFAFLAISLVIPFVFLPFVTIILKKRLLKREFFAFFLIIHYFWLIFCYNDLLFSLIMDVSQSFSLQILCIFLVFLNNLLGFCTMFLHRNVNFLENGLKVPFDGLFVSIFVLRVILAINFHVISSINLQYFLTQAFFCVSLLHFLRNYPLFPNDLLNRVYLSMLFSCEIAVISLFCCENLAIFAENSVFYALFLCAVPAIKLGNVLSREIYKKNIYNCSISCYFLEEIYAFSQDFRRERSVLNLQGFLKTHQKYCEEPMCAKNLGFSSISANLEAFIKEKFEVLARKNCENHEFIVIKYLTFLTLIDFNPIKCYYDLQKLEVRLRNQQKSLFFSTILAVLKRRLLAKIKTINLLQKKQADSSILTDSADFFEVLELQKKLENQLKSLVQQKAVFWENYCSGISTMYQLFAKTNQISRNIQSFLQLLLQEKSFKKPSFALLQRKILAIAHVLLTNRWDLAYKNQEEFVNLSKIFANKPAENLLGVTSFLDSGVATCLVSFLRKEGCFLAKSEGFARFFGYSSQDLQSLSHISQLMPRILADSHCRFFRNFLNKSKKELENCENRSNFIDSYAKNRENLVFPVRIFTGFLLKNVEDFVMTAGFLRTSAKDQEMVWLFEKHGKTVGVSQKLMRFFADFLDISAEDRVENLNILPLLAKIKPLIAEALQKNQAFIAKNQSSSLIFPEKCKSLLRVLREKQEEEQDFERFNNYSLKNCNNSRSRSLKTLTITNTNSKKRQKLRYLSSFSRSFGFESQENLQFSSKTDLELIELVLNRKKTRKFFVFFDFKAHFYRVDDENRSISQNFLPLFMVKILRISENGRTIGSNFSQKPQEIEKTASFEKINSESLRIPELPQINLTNFNDDVFRRENVKEIAENYKENYKEIDRIFINNIDNEPKTEENLAKTQENPNKIEEDGPKLIENELFSLKTHEKSEDSLRKPSSNSLNLGEKAKNRVDAGQSSSFSELKRSFLIFDAISRIKSLKPLSLKKILFFLLIQVLLSIIYSISLSQIFGDYTISSYKPIQKELISFCTLICGLELTFILMTDVEYLSTNLLISNRSAQFQQQAYWQIFNDTFFTAKQLTFSLRNSNLEVSSIRFYRELLVSYAEENVIKTVPWPDLIEYYVNICYDILKQGDVFLTNEFEREFLQRNFPNYVSAARILKNIESDFLESNAKTTEIAKIFMISLLVIACFFAFFTLYYLLSFHKLVSFLMNIFRRVNKKEALLEKNFLEEMLNIMKQPCLNVDFLEKSLNKASFSEEKAENLDKALKRNSIETVKEKAKVSRHDFKQLSRVKIFIFIIIFCVLGFIYYFFNYFYWVSNNDNIQNLIQLNIFFENLYIYSTSIVGFSVLYIREMLIKSPKYEASGEIYQNHEYRLKYFYPNYYKRIAIVNDITAHHMLEITSKAKTNLNDAVFNQLVSGNLCELLEKNHIIIAGTYNDCEQFLNGAFKKGIISLLKEFLNEMNLFQNYADFMVIPNNSAILQEQIRRAAEFINSVEYRDLVNSHYYLTKSILQFYEKINGFYYSLMETQMNGLMMFLIFTSIVFAVAIFVFAIVFYKKLFTFYCNVTFNMEIIPYERITGDEQTKFLIKQFLKKFD